MRPKYETAEHKSAEARIAARLEHFWKCRAVKLPTFYAADYALCRWGNRISALAEIKHRPNVKVRQYDRYVLGVSKLRALDDLCHTMDVLVFLVVQWNDALGYKDISRVLQQTNEFWIGGRADRNDSEDMEPVVYIPQDTFTILEWRGLDDPA